MRIWVDTLCLCTWEQPAFFECIKIYTNQLILDTGRTTDDLCVSLLDSVVLLVILSLLPSLLWRIEINSRLGWRPAPCSSRGSSPQRKIPRAAADRENWNWGERRRRDTNHESVRLLSRAAFWGGGGHKSAPVTHKHMLCPPAFSSPLVNEDLLGPGRSWCLLSITGFSATKHVTACYQPGQATCRARSNV